MMFHYKRSRIQQLAIGSLALLIIVSACQPKTENQKPNVLLILTDDQGWGDLSAHGNPVLNTPNLDNLKAEGASLTNFYVNPVCAPTRAAILTGRYAYRTGVKGVSRGLESMKTEEVTIAELLGDNGYQTGCFGKWHNGRSYDQHPLRQGFDTYLGFRGGTTFSYFDPKLEYNDQLNVPVEGYIVDVLTDSAMSFMKNAQKPFFCYLPFNTPHSPYQAPDRFFDKYKKEGLSDEIATIYAMVDNIDYNVGRIMQFMQQHELLENTLVIFTSDNGPTGAMGGRYNGGMKGFKGSLDEGGVRVPCFIYYKDVITPGIVINGITAHVDMLPTIAEWTESNIPQTISLDGTSLKNELTGSKVAERDRQHFTIQQIKPKQHAAKDELNYCIRTSQYRYIMDHGKSYLYDMIKDFSQTDNIAEQHKDMVASFEKHAQKMLSGVSDEDLKPIPITIGQAEANMHQLIADEARLTGDIAFMKGFGYNSDWATNFTSPGDSLYWHVESLQPKTYKVYIKYVCPPESVGSTYVIATGGDELSFTIKEPYAPGLIEVQNRAPTRGRASEFKEFKELYVGQIEVQKGATHISVMPKKTSSKDHSLELRAVYLK